MNQFKTDERTGLHYELQGDYYVIAGEADEAPVVGIWGQRHLRWLKQNRRVTYTNLLTTGRLYNYLREIDAQANGQLDALITKNSQSRGKFNIGMLDYFKVTDEFIECAKNAKDTRLLRKLQRARLSLICGTFKRMMLADFNEQNVIKPLLRELRHNLWVLLLNPRPFSVTAFGVCCAINFKLTKIIFLRIYRHAY